MPEFKFFCPHCGQHILCDTRHSGMRINCPGCQQAIVVPQTPATGPIPPPEPVHAYIPQPSAAQAGGRQYSVTPLAQRAVPLQSRALRTVLIIVVAVLSLAGLGVGGWYGYTHLKMLSGHGHLPAGLVALWSGEGDTRDSVSGQTATPVGRVNYASGKVGQAFSLNGSDAYVSAPDSPALNPTSAITVMGWINRRGVVGPYDPIINKGGDANAGYTLEFLNNNVAFWIYKNGWQSSLSSGTGGEVQLGRWYHVAGVYDGTNIRCYLDGQQVGTTALPPGPFSPSSIPLGIGYSHNLARYFNGLIDEPAIYNRALSAEEILAIYTAQK